MEKDTQLRIEETLRPEGYINEVVPKPFFYTRVKVRLENESAKSYIQLVPIPLRVVCAIVLIINVAYIFSSGQKQENESERLASFYRLNSNSIYSNR